MEFVKFNVAIHNFFDFQQPQGWTIDVDYYNDINWVSFMTQKNSTMECGGIAGQGQTIQLNMATQTNQFLFKEGWCLCYGAFRHYYDYDNNPGLFKIIQGFLIRCMYGIGASSTPPLESTAFSEYNFFNNWVNVKFTKNGNSSMPVSSITDLRLEVNGVELSLSHLHRGTNQPNNIITDYFNFKSLNNNFLIGVGFPNRNEFLSGNLRNFRLMDNSNLEDVLFLPLNESLGNIASDYSDNNFNGILNHSIVRTQLNGGAWI